MLEPVEGIRTLLNAAKRQVLTPAQFDYFIEHL